MSQTVLRRNDSTRKPTDDSSGGKPDNEIDQFHSILLSLYTLHSRISGLLRKNLIGSPGVGDFGVRLRLSGWCLPGEFELSLSG